MLLIIFQWGKTLNIHASWLHSDRKYLWVKNSDCVKSNLVGEKKVKFTEERCYLTDVNQKLIATETKEGSLYYVNCRESEHVHVTENVTVHKESK